MIRSQSSRVKSVELTFPWEDVASKSTGWIFILLPCCSFLLLPPFFFWQLHIAVWFLHVKICLVMVLCGIPVKAIWTAGSLQCRAALKSWTNWTFGFHVRVYDKTGEGGKRSNQWPVEGGSVFMITLICRMGAGGSSLQDVDYSEAALSGVQTQVKVQSMVLISTWRPLGFQPYEVDKAALWSSRTGSGLPSSTSLQRLFC